MAGSAAFLLPYYSLSCVVLTLTADSVSLYIQMRDRNAQAYFLALKILSNIFPNVFLKLERNVSINLKLLHLNLKYFWW